MMTVDNLNERLNTETTITVQNDTITNVDFTSLNSDDIQIQNTVTVLNDTITNSNSDEMEDTLVQNDTITNVNLMDLNSDNFDNFQIQDTMVQHELDRVKDIPQTVDQVIQYCKDNRINDPIEILCKLQLEILTGRELDVADPAQLLEGETHNVYIDRDDVLGTGFDEIKAATTNELRNPLNVAFYTEVCKICFHI